MAMVSSGSARGDSATSRNPHGGRRPVARIACGVNLGYAIGALLAGVTADLIGLSVHVIVAGMSRCRQVSRLRCGWTTRSALGDVAISRRSMRMAIACPADLDTLKLRAEIQFYFYARVAAEPGGEFHSTAVPVRGDTAWLRRV